MNVTTPKGWQSNDMTCMKLSFCHPFGVVVPTTVLAGVPCFALHHLPVLCPPLRGSFNIKLRQDCFAAPNLIAHCDARRRRPLCAHRTFCSRPLAHCDARRRRPLCAHRLACFPLFVIANRTGTQIFHPSLLVFRFFSLFLHHHPRFCEKPYKNTPWQM